MSIIKIYPSKVKQKKKPGWEKEKAEHDAWLKKINSMTLFANKKPQKVTKFLSSPVVNTTMPTISEARKKAFNLPSRETAAVNIRSMSPEVLYKENPEMLERELAARSIKFTTAPIYNKGGDTYITDEMMKDITAGITRRR